MDHGERIAVLETEVRGVKEVQQEILTKQDQILVQLTRYKGFLGGIFFVFSTLGTLWMFVGEWAKIKLGFK